MRLYRLLLRLYPASFRAEYGEEMCNIFAVRQCKENALGLWIGAILDVLSNAIRVHADILRQDLRWTFRALRQSPAFTLTAVSVAALGMGANTAAFTLLDHVLLRPLPFPHPEKLVMLYLTEPGGGYMHLELSPPNYLDLRAMTHSFEAFSAYSGLSINLSGQGDPQRLNGANLGAGIFQILGAQPALGRAFTPEDERNGTPDSVLLSDHLWRTVFGADPNVLGRTVRLDDQPYTVIGVMPAAFAFPSRDAQLWLPLRFPPFRPTERTNFYLYGVARLRKDVSLEQARADLSVAAAQLERAYPKDNVGIGATAFEMRDMVSPQSRMLIFAVFGAAFCVLLIACSNLANLLLARAMTRRREIAVRIAIGAGRAAVAPAVAHGESGSRRRRAGPPVVAGDFRDSLARAAGAGLVAGQQRSHRGFAYLRIRRGADTGEQHRLRRGSRAAGLRPRGRRRVTRTIRQRREV